MQRKILVLTLTALISVCLYFSYTLNKKLNHVIKKIFNLESSLLTINDPSEETKEIRMNITDLKTQPESTLKNKGETLGRTIRCVYDENIENTVNNDISNDEDDESNDDLNNTDSDDVDVKTMLVSSISSTNNNIQTMNNQLQRLIGLKNVNNTLTSQNNSESDYDDDDDDDDDNDSQHDEGLNSIIGTVERLEFVNEPVENHEESQQLSGKCEDDGEGEDEDDEVEYIIEYETVSDNDEEDKENETSDTITIIKNDDDQNITEYIQSMSHNHTKVNLIDILKKHELSTFGNKNTLIKRIMTIDNFQKILHA